MPGSSEKMDPSLSTCAGARGSPCRMLNSTLEKKKKREISQFAVFVCSFIVRELAICIAIAMGKTAALEKRGCKAFSMEVWRRAMSCCYCGSMQKSSVCVPH